MTSGLASISGMADSTNVTNVSLLGGKILTTSEFNCLFKKPNIKGTLQWIICLGTVDTVEIGSEIELSFFRNTFVNHRNTKSILWKKTTSEIFKFSAKIMTRRIHFIISVNDTVNELEFIFWRNS